MKLCCLGKNKTGENSAPKKPVWQLGAHNLRIPIKAITDCIDNRNQNPQAFVWTASTEKLM